MFKDYKLTPLGNGREAALRKFYSYIIDNKIAFEKVEKCLCGSNEQKTISTHERYGIPVPTVICKKCGLIYQSTKMTEESLPVFYDDIYWGMIYGNDDSQCITLADTSTRKIFKFIEEHIDNDKGNILEIGCGSGEKLLGLRTLLLDNKKDYTLFGCDYSQRAVELANQKGVPAKHGGVNSMDIKLKFDIIIISHVLEHVSDIQTFLSDVKKYCHQDTLLYIEVPGVSDLIHKKEYGYSYLDYCVCAHIYNFNASSLKTVMSLNGFRCIESTEFVQSMFKLSGSNQVLINSENYDATLDTLKAAEERAARFNRNPIRKFVKSLRSIRESI